MPLTQSLISKLLFLNFRALTLDMPKKGCLNYCCCCCFGTGVKLLTHIQVLKAEGLERQDIGSGNCQNGQVIVREGR